MGNNTIIVSYKKVQSSRFKSREKESYSLYGSFSPSTLTAYTFKIFPSTRTKTELYSLIMKKTPRKLRHYN